MRRTNYLNSFLTICLVLAMTAITWLPVQALTLTSISPDALQTFAEEDEYFTRVWGDPKDIDHPSDLYLIDSSCNPALNRLFNDESVSNGLWQATTIGTPSSGSDTRDVLLLNPGWVSSLAIGQDGRARPIDAAQYRQLTFRLYASSADEVTWARVIFTAQTIGTLKDTIPFRLYNGWNIYTINLSQRSTQWNGSITGLWFSFFDTAAGVNLKLDWVRLTPTQSRSLNWTGSDLTGATIRLAFGSGNDYDPLRSFTTGERAENIPAGNINDSSGSYNVPASFWPGTYQVRGTVSRSGSSSSTVTSAGSWTFKAAPIAEIIAPSYISGPDFATTVVGNPWDMIGIDDIDAAHTENLDYSATGGVLNVTSRGGPHVCGNAAHLPLALNMGGQQVDSNTFKYLTFRYKVNQAPDQGDGGVIRVRWIATHLPYWPAGRTDDISLYHNQWQTYKLDLSQVALEGETADWKNLSYNVFQIMAHESTDAWTSHLDWVRLTSENTAQGSYLVKWNLFGATGVNLGYSSEVTTTIYWATKSGSTYTLIGSGYAVPTEPPSVTPPPGPLFIYLPIVLKNYGAATNLDDANFAYSIPTTGLTVGQSYYVALKLQDGYNTVWWYSELPVRIIN